MDLISTGMGRGPLKCSDRWRWPWLPLVRSSLGTARAVEHGGVPSSAHPQVIGLPPNPFLYAPWVRPTIGDAVRSGVDYEGVLR